MLSVMTLRTLWLLCCVGVGTGLAQNQPLPKRYQVADASPSQKSFELDIPGDKQWTDTGVDVLAGARLSITGTGSLQYAQAQAAGPEGLSRGWKDLLRVLPLNDAGRGALIGRIGTGDLAGVFAVGAKREVRTSTPGRLYLGVNQMSNEVATGSFHVSIQVLEAGSAAALELTNLATDPTKATARVPGVNDELFAKIPRRIGDQQGNPGDMVNFLILGTEDQMRKAFQGAGWVLVDRTKTGAVLHGLLSTLSKQAYVELPMSELYLFGRPQDFGFAHAEPFAVVASRHHLRVWKAPFDVSGQTLWVGAATHDIGFDKDQRNNGITHKIDPNIDDERKFVAGSLAESGVMTQVAYLKPRDPMLEAKTATGGTFHSDGNVLILVTGVSTNDRSTDFANLFCTVLDQEHPDEGQWGGCSQYLDAPAQGKADLPPISNKYKVLIVPGVFSACVESAAPAFKEGQTHLHDKHGLTVELLSIPNASSETNAQTIAQYLKDHRKDDERKYIVVGYSKGAPDLQVALTNDAEAAAGVAAFVTVAGAVGGSPIADLLPAQVDRWLKAYNVTKCEGDLAATFKSLQRGARQAFLAAHPDPPVPSYSIAAVSDRSNTSKFMLENWLMMSVYGPKQDSQLIQADTVVPGAVFLGSAKADHFAIALPFESSSDASVRSAFDKNHFPRTALLEALVRYVTQDIEKK